MKRNNQDYNGVSESFMNQFECCSSVGLSFNCMCHCGEIHNFLSVFLLSFHCLITRQLGDIEMLKAYP